MSFGYKIMTTNIFSIAVFGFSHIERTLFASVCKLSQARLQQGKNHEQAGFKIIEPNKAENIDIFLIDGDNAEALQSGQEAHSQSAAAPVITISKSPKEPANPGEFTLARHRAGGLLLKFLDQIVEPWIAGNDTKQPSKNKSAKCCLVVDDSQLVRTQMELLLKDYDLNVRFAEDAETALRIVKQLTFDIIFLDVMLPEMNGYKACKLLKSDSNTSATPVVMLTSKKSPFNKMHGALVGCDKYLTKPVDPSRVHQVLRQYDVIDAGKDYETAGLAIG